MSDCVCIYCNNINVIGGSDQGNNSQLTDEEVYRNMCVHVDDAITIAESKARYLEEYQGLDYQGHTHFIEACAQFE